MIALPLALLFAQSDLPKAPEGVQVREVVKVGGGDLPGQPARCRPHPKTGLFYLVYTNGDLWEIDAAAGTKKPILEGKAYVRKDAGFLQVLGLHIDAAGLFYVVTNERFDSETPKRAHVVV